YFIYADEPKLKKVIEIICEHIPLFLYTWEGSQVAMLCFSYGTVKECKVMLKSMKEYIAKICKEEYGYLVLLRAFDVVDDTVSVTKYIIDVSFDTFQLLEKGDEIRAKTSKKDPAIRTNELRKAISPALINYAKENTAEMLSNTYMTQIFCDTLLCGETAIEEKISILENIPALIGDTSNENNIMLSCQLQRLDNGQYKDKQDKRVELHFARFILKNLGRVIKSLIKTSNDKSKLNKRKRKK
ncbi:12960_t:CDS:2, partial [Gigaspora margarita]